MFHKNSFCQYISFSAAKLRQPNIRLTGEASIGAQSAMRRVSARRLRDNSRVQLKRLLGQSSSFLFFHLPKTHKVLQRTKVMYVFPSVLSYILFFLRALPPPSLRAIPPSDSLHGQHPCCVLAILLSLSSSRSSWRFSPRALFTFSIFPSSSSRRESGVVLTYA